MESKQRKQNRLKNYDYSEPGSYFVTICAKGHENWFGEIVDGRMVLNEIGKIAKKILINIPNHFEHTIIDEFIIMPNHVHLIIIIDLSISAETLTDTPVGDADLRPLQNDHQNKVRDKMQIPLLIQQYKSTVTRIIRKEIKNTAFFWQRSFHDHIIRDEKEYNKIKHYIKTNSLNWQFDIENQSEKNNLNIKHYVALYEELYK